MWRPFGGYKCSLAGNLGLELTKQGFPGSSDGKKCAYNAEDLGSIPWVEKTPLEKGMATHSSILVLRIPWTDHGVASVGNDWATNTHKAY